MKEIMILVDKDLALVDFEQAYLNAVADNYVKLGDTKDAFRFLWLSKAWTENGGI